VVLIAGHSPAGSKQRPQTTSRVVLRERKENDND
jgi:hypothetical protein